MTKFEIEHGAYKSRTLAVDGSEWMMIVHDSGCLSFAEHDAGVRDDGSPPWYNISDRPITRDQGLAILREIVERQPVPGMYAIARDNLAALQRRARQFLAEIGEEI